MSILTEAEASARTRNADPLMTFRRPLANAGGIAIAGAATGMA